MVQHPRTLFLVADQAQMLKFSVQLNHGFPQAQHNIRRTNDRSASSRISDRWPENNRHNVAKILISLPLELNVPSVFNANTIVSTSGCESDVVSDVSRAPRLCFGALFCDIELSHVQSRTQADHAIIES